MKDIKELMEKILEENKSLFDYKPRSAERIAEMVALLEEIWTKCPDLRLGQLIVNLSGDENKLFYMEDDEMLERMEAFRDYISKEE